MRNATAGSLTSYVAAIDQGTSSSRVILYEVDPHTVQPRCLCAAKRVLLNSRLVISVPPNAYETKQLPRCLLPSMLPDAYY